jgi:acetylornithine deacetylase
MNIVSEQIVSGYVDAHADRLINILRDLVQIPSENHPPTGEEEGCQNFVVKFLDRLGWNPRSYIPSEVPGITEHPFFWKGRDYSNRPNVYAKRSGSGGGRSLILSGHIDTVPVGTPPWKFDPFGATVEGNRLYGRGSVDMKCGIATNLFVAEALTELGITLAGDLTIETVVDEEFGGVNGTLAGRVSGILADAAIISEPSFLRVCPAQRGGRAVHITFANPNEGILSDVDSCVAEQLRVFLNAVPVFREQRLRTAKKHPLYAHLSNPVPVTIARIHTADWGTHEPPNTPDRCRVEVFWQAMPGETVEDIDREFFEWFDGLIAANPGVFPERPSISYPHRWLPGSALNPDHNLVEVLGNIAEATTGERPAVQGIEGPCDMYVFHEFGMPAVLWGARGGNLHHVDEYVEIDSVIQATKVLLAFVLHWCGEEKGR